MVGGVNLALAVIVIIAAMRIQPGPEEEMVRDIREMALNELSADLDEVKDDFSRISEDLGKIKHGVSNAVGMVRSGSSGVGTALHLVTSMLKR